MHVHLLKYLIHNYGLRYGFLHTFTWSQNL